MREPGGGPRTWRPRLPRHHVGGPMGGPWIQLSHRPMPSLNPGGRHCCPAPSQVPMRCFSLWSGWGWNGSEPLTVAMAGFETMTRSWACRVGLPPGATPGEVMPPGGLQPRLRVEAGGEDSTSGGSLTPHCSGKLRAGLRFLLSCSAYLTKWLTCEQGK